MKAPFSGTSSFSKTLFSRDAHARVLGRLRTKKVFQQNARRGRPLADELFAVHVLEHVVQRVLDEVTCRQVVQERVDLCLAVPDFHHVPDTQSTLERSYARDVCDSGLQVSRLAST